MQTFAGLTATQLIVAAIISIGGALTLPAPWYWIVFGLGFVAWVMFQRWNRLRFRLAGQLSTVVGPELWKGEKPNHLVILDLPKKPVDRAGS